ncbi:hypothetical protein JHK87_033973 [Glycine soja]|nr:hypothetical protein JHK87_033973 [Glycine soja]
MAAQLIHDRLEMECLEGAWETLEGNTRCRFRGTIRFTATSLVHPDEPARTLQRTVEWILPTPTPYRLVEPVQLIEVTSSEEDPEEDPEELPPEPAVDALDFLEGDEDPLPEVDSPEEVMSASEADSTEDSGPREMAISGGSSSFYEGILDWDSELCMSRVSRERKANEIKPPRMIWPNSPLYIDGVCADTNLPRLHDIFQGGVEGKTQVDKVIGKCASMQNLHEAIATYRNSILRQPDEMKREPSQSFFVEMTEKGFKYTLSIMSFESQCITMK